MQWHTSLSAVTGIRWDPPIAVEADPALARMTPRPRNPLAFLDELTDLAPAERAEIIRKHGEITRESDEHLRELGHERDRTRDFEWVVGGQVLDEPWPGARPCEYVAGQIYQAPDAPTVAELAFKALSVPGTTSDYLEAVRFGTTPLTMRGDAGTYLLELQEAAMALIEADPAAARDARRQTGRNPEEVLREPYRVAAQVLLANGLTADAAAVERREVATLGPWVGPGVSQPATATLEALSEVWGEQNT